MLLLDVRVQGRVAQVALAASADKSTANVVVFGAALVPGASCIVGTAFLVIHVTPLVIVNALAILVNVAIVAFVI